MKLLDPLFDNVLLVVLTLADHLFELLDLGFQHFEFFLVPLLPVVELLDEQLFQLLFELVLVAVGLRIGQLLGEVERLPVNCK